MAKPIIKKIEPFDANLDYEIRLSWTGNRAYANRIIIYNNDTNDVVFDDTVTSFSLSHIIPAHTLTNGKKWVIQAQTIDEQGVSSTLSDKVLFYTFETPNFYFSNIPTDNKVTSSSFGASIYYYSSDWEDLNTCIFHLYDSTKKLLLESDPIFNNDNEITYAYRGLDNNTVYYIRCIGVTVNGMEVDTGYVQINVNFENPNAYTRIYTTNLPSQGCIQIASNLIIIQYNGTDSFTYEDGMINLIDQTLYYDEGFNVEDDFTIIIRGTNLWQNADILKMNNGNMGLTLSSHIYPGGNLRFRLIVPNGVSNYLLYSEPLVFENSDMITIAIRRINNVYQIKTFIELGYTTEGNMWYGTLRPTNGTSDYDSWIDVSGNTYVVNKDSYTTFLDIDEPLTAILDDLWIGGE